MQNVTWMGKSSSSPGRRRGGTGTRNRKISEASSVSSVVSASSGQIDFSDSVPQVNVCTYIYLQCMCTIGVRKPYIQSVNFYENIRSEGITFFG